MKDFQSLPPDVLSRKNVVEIDIRIYYQPNNSPVTIICQKATQMVIELKVHSYPARLRRDARIGSAFL